MSAFSIWSFKMKILSLKIIIVTLTCEHIVNIFSVFVIFEDMYYFLALTSFHTEQTDLGLW